MYLFNYFSPDLVPGMGLQDHIVTIFSLLRKLHTIFHSGCTNLHSSQHHRKGSLFSTPSPSLHLLSVDFLMMATAHCSFDLHFSNNLDSVIMVCVSALWCLSQHLPSYLGFSSFGRGVSLQGCSSKAQPLLLTLNEGYLLTTALPDLQREILQTRLQQYVNWELPVQATFRKGRGPRGQIASICWMIEKANAC